jgi:cbb3-type cytochrome oxidase subunit 3
MTHLFDFLSSYGWFFGIPIAFLAVVAWIYRPGAKRRYRDDARIPFKRDSRSS